ncbi:LuxE/PaaK family acyltransferase [Roseivirga spongicola]|uniref:LuxE/PaaK family acyltransferase n=1 Tax=Roseivirga spongicola TaxID=333140 RepID=UPI002AC983AD|nr:acyl transferase [Roseivirga spongicola]WPZ10394.1 acyl transferase [Roseivirga spongicola]
MLQFNSLIDRIKTVGPNTFEALAIDIFKLQYTHNQVYKEWCDSLKKTPNLVERLEQVPFLPIEFFKSHDIRTGSWNEQLVFESSGTTGSETSKHFVHSEYLYLENCVTAFEKEYGDLSDYVILALLPSYLERGNSGLISMVNHFIQKTESEESGFYLNEFQQLYDHLLSLKETGKKVILWGVTFALLDFAEEYSINFPDLIIMETGGMKGRREELVRSEVHNRLQDAFGVVGIHSEYGMTELFSQGYSKGQGVFQCSNTMAVMGRDVNDPLNYPSKNKTVALNVIDLANIYTCSFIETKDLGSVYSDGSFEVKGRLDNSDIRGCNLLVV